ncbi:hypothetical protein ACQP2F_15545 [Actinoplanes sp. CA-030573]|uniref:hypothetical protein n=1 Tax=Actinoplanes sp. CA-030573 TaxID=3239898 RepID=UPI003D8DCF0F
MVVIALQVSIGKITRDERCKAPAADGNTAVLVARGSDPRFDVASRHWSALRRQIAENAVVIRPSRKDPPKTFSGNVHPLS